MKHRPDPRWASLALAAAITITPLSASAADVTVTITENALNTFAASVEKIGGAGTFALDVQTYSMTCQAQFGGACSVWMYQPSTITVPIAWSWELLNPRFEIVPSKITFHAIVKINFDGKISMIPIQRDGYASYSAPANMIHLLLDFMDQAQAPLHVTRYGETLFLGNINPFKYFSAMIGLGTAAAPSNVQITHQNNQLRITSDVDFNG